MSNLPNDLAHCQPEACAPCSAIRSLLQPRDKDLGGFPAIPGETEFIPLPAD
jgi:hypothetical protein